MYISEIKSNRSRKIYKFSNILETRIATAGLPIRSWAASTSLTSEPLLAEVGSPGQVSTPASSGAFPGEIVGVAGSVGACAGPAAVPGGVGVAPPHGRG